MLRAQEELEALRLHHVLDAKRQNIHLLVHRSLHLAPHLRGLLVLLAENTNTMVRAGKSAADTSPRLIAALVRASKLILKQPRRTLNMRSAIGAVDWARDYHLGRLDNLTRCRRLAITYA